MFKCSNCGQSRKSGRLVVQETRDKEYREERRVGNRYEEVVVGSGFETVRESRICDGCLAGGVANA